MICRTQDDVLMTDSPKMASHNFDEQSDSDINLASVVSSGKNSRINQSRNVKVRNDNNKELQNLVGKKPTSGTFWRPYSGYPSRR